MFCIKVLDIGVRVAICVALFTVSFVELVDYFGDRKIKLCRENGICKSELKIVVVCFLLGVSFTVSSVIFYIVVWNGLLADYC